MIIEYDQKTDLLYLRVDPRAQDVVNKRVADEVVLDIGAGDKIVGIEIMNASHNVDLAQLLPVHIQEVG